MGREREVCVGGWERVKTWPREIEREREREGEKRKRAGVGTTATRSASLGNEGVARIERERESPTRDDRGCERDRVAAPSCTGSDACVLCLYRLGGKGRTRTHARTYACTRVRKEGKREATTCNVHAGLIVGTLSSR